VPVSRNEQNLVRVKEVSGTKQELSEKDERQNQVRQVNVKAKKDHTKLLGTGKAQGREKLIDLVTEKDESKKNGNGVGNEAMAEVGSRNSEGAGGQDTDVGKENVKVSDSRVKGNRGNAENTDTKRKELPKNGVWIQNSEELLFGLVLGLKLLDVGRGVAEDGENSQTG